MTGPGLHGPGPAVVEASAWFRKQLLDGAYRFADQFVLAMRAEGVPDEVIGRVLDRVTVDVPDPDEVITTDREGRPR